MSALDEPDQLLILKVKQSLAEFTSNSNSGRVSEASQQFSTLANQKGFVSALFYLVCNEAAVPIRQLAAVILRRKLVKFWKSLNDSSKDAFRQAVLNQLIAENEKVVSKSLMQIIGSLARQEFSVGRPWNEMINLIVTSCKGADLQAVQTGMELLSVVCESAYEHLDQHYSSILTLINEVLNNPGITMETSTFSILAFKALVPLLGSDHKNVVLPLVPKCVEVTQLVLKVDETKASDMLEIFECLIETEVGFISPYVKDIVLFSLEITKSSELEEDTRVRSLSLLQFIISCKKKAILKHNLVDDILKTIWPIIMDSSDSDDDVGFIGDEADTQTPFSSSLHVIDEMALHLPPDKLFKSILPLIEESAKSTFPGHRRGLLLTLACLTEGTSEYIKENHIQPFVSLACEGAVSENEETRNAAMFAIGQFAEFLEPEICSFANQVMPILFSALQRASSTKGIAISRAYYALENFVENLDTQLEPYLEQLMSYLITRMQTTTDIKEKTMVVSALGAIGNAAKDKLQGYMSTILELIQACLQSSDDDVDSLHTQALDTLGVFVRTFGKNNSQLAWDSLNLGITIINRETDDPEMRRAAFGLFSAVSSVIEEKMESALPQIVESMLKSVNSSDGVQLVYTNDNPDSSSAPLDLSFLNDAEEDLDDAADEDDDVEAFTVENSYMEEKTDACQALGDLAKFTKHAFLHFLPNVFDELIAQIDYPYAELRRVVISSCGQFVMTAYQLAGDLYPSLLSKIFRPYCEMLVRESERVVVMSTLYTFKELIQTCGVDTFANKDEDLKMLMEGVMRILNQKSACQDSGEELEDEDDQQAEYDEMLIEYCGELFPVLSEKLGQSFLPYFQLCTPFFLGKMKKSSSSTERSFATGALADTIDKFGGESATSFVAPFMPKFLELISDKQPEVRNNVIFAIGVFMQFSDDQTACSNYPSALNALSTALNKEDKRFVVDNVLGAVARMVMSHPAYVPLKQVIPVMLQRLPIEEDHDEDMTVYGCLAGVLRLPEVCNDSEMRDAIINTMSQACSNEKISEEVRQNIKLAMNTLCQEGIIQSS